MISLLAVDPSFGGAYNLKKAFQAIDDVTLICTHLDKWRVRPGSTIDYVVGENGTGEGDASQVVQNSRFVFLVGGSAVTVAEHLRVDWCSLNTAAWFTDTYFKENPEQALEFLDYINTKKYFALPDSCYANYVPKNAFPLHHAVSIGVKGRQARNLTVMHSPGTEHKRPQKGSDGIERVISRLQKLYAFEYKCLMRLPHSECLAHKAKAHVFVDKVNGNHGSDGLGKSGLEAMAMGAVTFCPYPPSASAITEYTEPPMFKPRTFDEFEMALSYLIESGMENINRLGDEGRAWVTKYWGLENGAWLRYFRRFVTL